MKILQVNCVYKMGSTGKIIADIHNQLLENGIESVVCYGRGKKIKEPHVYKTCSELYSKANNLLSRFTGIMYGGCIFSTSKLISIIKKEKPDVVHLHCINGYFVNIYRLIKWLKKNRIKTVITLHAEFMYTANCGHAFECEKWKSGCGKCPRLKKETKSMFIDGTAKSWNRMKDAFRGFEEDCIVVSVSPWLMERAKQSPILATFKHATVLNGLDTEIFMPRYEKRLREKYGLENKKIVLHATPSFSMDSEHIKGGWYVVQMAKSMPECMFVVVGEYEKNVKAPPNMLFVGRVENQKELSEWYATADVTLLTSKKETFSMIVAESLCCGTPVVGFKAGAPEMIAIEEYSEFVEYGNIDRLVFCLQMWLEKEINTDVVEIAKKQYSKKKMYVEYKET